jgi:hypothetical protein
LPNARAARRIVMNNARAGRLGLTIVLAIYGFILLRNPGSGSLMDSVDLPIHETGHLVFSPLGEFMQFLGGTLFQLIMPAVFVGYFLKRGDKHAATAALWWVAQSCWNISVYVKDARSQELDLVGGGEHDWAYLLGHLGWLKQDQRLGQFVWLVGVLVYLVAIVGGYLALSAVGKPQESAEAVVS